jgi:hypothetical protein
MQVHHGEDVNMSMAAVAMKRESESRQIYATYTDLFAIV